MLIECPDCNGPARIRKISDERYCRNYYSAGCISDCNEDKDYSAPVTRRFDSEDEAKTAWNTGEWDYIKFRIGASWTGD